MTSEEAKDELYRLLSDCISELYPRRKEEQKKRYREAVKMAIEAINRRAEEKEPEEAAEASQSTKKSWTAEEIQKAADLLKERFLQNADFLFCSPEDEADIEKKVGDRFKVKGMQGIPPGRIYLVDRKEMERWWPSSREEQEDET